MNVRIAHGVVYGLCIVVVVSLVILGNKVENFEGTSISSNNSIQLLHNNPESGLPLFLNYYKKFGPDYKLLDFLRRSELNNTNPTIQFTKPNRNLKTFKDLPPIILVPGLGSTNIFAKWNKSETKNVKTVDESGEFDKPEQWSCKQYQNEWTNIWPPEVTGIASGCWENNTEVHPVGTNGVDNSIGVITTTEQFGTINFKEMNTMVTMLEAVGYEQGVTLFGAGYDFRTITDEEKMNSWCMAMSNLIEKSSGNNKKQCIIIGHDLGSVISNYFLVNSVQKWKDNYIKSFITISGAFGGTPKALREILSDNEVIKNFSGLSLMLPNPVVYGNKTLINYNQSKYTSRDIPKLLSEDSKKVFDISNDIRDKSMMAPGTTVYIMMGNKIDTESEYTYSKSMYDSPEVLNPVNRTDAPFNQDFHYSKKFDGDGTMPSIALKYPIIWTKYQKNPVFFQFFGKLEHTKILESYDSLKYLISIIK